MSDVVIRVENLYKEYRLGTISHGTLHQDLQSWWARLRGKEDPNSIISSSRPFTTDDSRFTASENPHMLALNNISFEVQRGEVLGIIGRNGAGKSTLLKILSEVTSPTKGLVKIKGRVASLLEVGTGFHPELTGRENVYLNGAILGMTKKEIGSKFDEIVAFAEIEKFIDTPVKRYSSGMYVRLAFAVAAHLEPEILIVDEVLAVGDATFQKKCLGKMGEVAKGGRTVLFVSHNMAAVQNLCSRCLLLIKGAMCAEGEPYDVVMQYLDENDHDAAKIELSDRRDRTGAGRIIFTAAWIENENGEPVSTVHCGQNVRLVATYKSATGSKIDGLLTVAFALNNGMSLQLADLWNECSGEEWNEVYSEGKVICCLPDIPLNVGHYSFNVCARINTTIEDMVQNVAFFDIEAADFFKIGRLPEANQGNFLFRQKWSLEDTSAITEISI